jgi:hypothetical protein
MKGAQAGFMSYWRAEGLADDRLGAYGRSLALHGLPLTEARMETNANGDTVLTQWFERGRMEWHPNNPANFRVLLGLLGTEVRGSTTPTSRPLRYFWPKQVPRGFEIKRGQSFADDTRFELHVAEPNDGQFRATIQGGVGSELPRRHPGTRTVTVRGQQGTAFTTGAGYAIFWIEDERPYAITGNLGLDAALNLAEQLEPLSLSAWNQRLK